MIYLFFPIILFQYQSIKDFITLIFFLLFCPKNSILLIPHSFLRLNQNHSYPKKTLFLYKLDPIYIWLNSTLTKNPQNNYLLLFPINIGSLYYLLKLPKYISLNSTNINNFPIPSPSLSPNNSHLNSQSINSKYFALHYSLNNLSMSIFSNSPPPHYFPVSQINHSTS
jgi:hypothetical protein